MKFSERIGLDIPKIPFQIRDMNIELKNSLWNAFYIFVLKLVEPVYHNRVSLDSFVMNLYADVIKTPINTRSHNYSNVIIDCQMFYDSLEWNKTYEFLEFFIEKNYINKEAYIKEINMVLERENSGYRVINNLFTPIVDDIQIDAINYALEQNKIKGVQLHLSNALKELSNKVSPNYPNVVKESISAVESVSKLITKENTLGSALQRMEKSGIIINKQLKEGFLKFYNYTNDPKSGIRHAIMDDHTAVDFETAKFMLVACSAFVNYLVSFSSRI